MRDEGFEGRGTVWKDNKKANQEEEEFFLILSIGDRYKVRIHLSLRYIW